MIYHRAKIYPVLRVMKRELTAVRGEHPPAVIVTTPDDLERIVAASVAAALADWQPPSTPGPFDHLPELLDRKQAAELLGISRPTLDLWAKAGKVNKYHLDGLVRLKKSELLDSLQNLRKYHQNAPKRGQR